MSRAPGTNGHSAEAARARGGYDAFFTPVPGQPNPASVQSDPAVTSDVHTAEVAEPDTVATTVAPPVDHAPAPAPPPHPSRAQVVIGEGGQQHSQPTHGSSVIPPGESGMGDAMRPGGAPSATVDQRSAPTPAAAVSGPAPATSAGPAASSLPAPSHTSANPPAAAADRTAHSAGATWSAATAPARTGWQPMASQGAASAYLVDPAASSSRLPDRAAQASPEGVEILPATLTSAELLAEISASNRARLKSSTGVRGALNKVGFNLGPSAAEQRKQNRRSRIRRQLTNTYQIAVVSVKGGVGRTTVAAALGSTFAALRPDRVVAIDANPDFGDLPTRTSSHPYGLTLRDLVLSPNLDAFSAVHSYTAVNDADLAVIASPWSTESVEPLSGPEFSAAVAILRRHYNLMLTDCGTGVLDSATGSVLQTSDAIVVVTPATVGGVKGAVATLNWLNSHGMRHLIAKSVVAIVHHHPVRPTVEVEQIEKLFATAHRPTFIVPYDAHLAEGGEIDLRLLDEETALAFEELAAAVADGFPGSPLTGGAAEHGGWR